MIAPVNETIPFSLIYRPVTGPVPRSIGNPSGIVPSRPRSIRRQRARTGSTRARRAGGTATDGVGTEVIPVTAGTEDRTEVHADVAFNDYAACTGHPHIQTGEHDR